MAELSAHTEVHCDVDGSPQAQPHGPCDNCHQRPATAWWCPSGTIGFVHGFAAAWCQVCVVTEQLRHARDMAARIPELEQELQRLQAADQGVLKDGGG